MKKLKKVVIALLFVFMLGANSALADSAHEVEQNQIIIEIVPIKEELADAPYLAERQYEAIEWMPIMHEEVGEGTTSFMLLGVITGILAAVAVVRIFSVIHVLRKKS